MLRWSGWFLVASLVISFLFCSLGATQSFHGFLEWVSCVNYCRPFCRVSVAIHLCICLFQSIWLSDGYNCFPSIWTLGGADSATEEWFSHRLEACDSNEYGCWDGWLMKAKWTTMWHDFISKKRLRHHQLRIRWKRMIGLKQGQEKFLVDRNMAVEGLV